MISRKSAPSLARRASSLAHVFGAAGLRDLEPKFEQFSVDPRRAPQRVLNAHLRYERTQLRLKVQSPDLSHPRARK